jgi:hypothetical protein
MDISHILVQTYLSENVLIICQSIPYMSATECSETIKQPICLRYNAFKDALRKE